MSAIPLRQPTQQHTILKLYNTPYALDPYRDRLVSQGYNVLDSATYREALEQAHRHRPQIFLVYDDLDAGIDALKWIELQHGDRFGWMATTPILILADAGRLELLQAEQMPDRIVVLQRRADTLNQLTRAVKYLLRINHLNLFDD